MRARRVLSLPMRNWNFHNLCTASTWFPRFESTYEELKLQCKRKENHRLQSFESTYEELKRFSNRRNKDLSPCFESTYEELKPSYMLSRSTRLHSFWVYLWGIETCYTHPFLMHFFFVLSLPMRNWNSWCCIPSWPGAHGFESTYEELKLLLCFLSLGTLSTVLSLPMRNWNLSKLGRLTMVFFRFESTYEELKRKIYGPFGQSRKSFESTYEELKLGKGV